MEEKIKQFYEVKQEEIYEKYKKEIKHLNRWFREKTGEAYIKSCEKEYELRKKEKINDEELDKIFEDYKDELDEIFHNYILQENKIYSKYLLRK